MTIHPARQRLLSARAALVPAVMAAVLAGGARGHGAEPPPSPDAPSAAAAQWRTWQDKLVQVAAKAKSLNDRANVPIETRIKAWKLLLANFKDDNPTTGDDDAIRADAVKALAALEAQAGAGRPDGLVKLGVNFLLPYITDEFDPARLGGTLREFSEAPKGLNPLLESDATSSDINELVNDSLCTRDNVDPERWRSQLATSAVISADYTTYTFTIRGGVRWQRPPIASEAEFAWLDRDVELTSRDFAFTLELIRHPEVECPHLKVYYEDIDRIETPDERTLRVIWKKKVYISLAASLALEPLPRHIYGARKDGTPLSERELGVAFNHHWFDERKQVAGVGRYNLKSFESDKEVVFVRNPAYWGSTLHFQELRWDGAIKQPDPQLVAFKNGQVHFHGLRPGQYKSEVLDRKEPRFAAIDPADAKAGRSGEFGWERVKGLNYNYLGWNLRLPLFSDRRVRQAMSHAFPKKRIIAEVFHGLGQPQNTDVHVDSPYYNRDLPEYAFDPDRSRALLAEAGWTDSDGDGWVDKAIDGERRPFSFTIKYYANSPDMDNMLLIYKEQLKRIGVELKMMALEWKHLTKVYEDRDFEAITGGWRMSQDIDFRQLWHSSEADKPQSSNHCGFKNARVDQLSDDLRATFETDKRILIAKEVQRILWEEQPYTFFRSGEGILIWHNRPAEGRAMEPGRQLAGVGDGLDKYFPVLRKRPRNTWYLRTR